MVVILASRQAQAPHSASFIDALLAQAMGSPRRCRASRWSSCGRCLRRRPRWPSPGARRPAGSFDREGRPRRALATEDPGIRPVGASTGLEQDPTLPPSSVPHIAARPWRTQPTPLPPSSLSTPPRPRRPRERERAWSTLFAAAVEHAARCGDLPALGVARPAPPSPSSPTPSRTAGAPGAGSSSARPSRDFRDLRRSKRGDRDAAPVSVCGATVAGCTRRTLSGCRDGYRSHVRTGDSSGELPVLVEFSRWCGPCKTVAPELLAIPDELRGRQVVIDVDKSPMIARELGVQSV